MVDPVWGEVGFQWLIRCGVRGRLSVVDPVWGGVGFQWLIRCGAR